MISTNDLFELKLRALDGDIGSVRDLVFHDTDWAIHALIAETGGWLFGRRVSIDPDALIEPDLAGGVLELDLTKEQVKNSPAADAVQPPSEQPISEEVLQWNQSNALAAVPETMLLAGATMPIQPFAAHTPPLALHLRNLRDVLGDVVTAGEEPAGTLTGFLVDPIAWDLPVALVELQAGGPTVMLPTRLITALGWEERVLHTYLQPSVLNEAPVYDPRILDERLYLPEMADYYFTRA